MKLNEFLEKVREADGREISAVNIPADGSPELSRVEYDSRKVAGEGGTIFACVPGTNADGHDFASDAVRDGAVALLCERRLGIDAPQIITADVRSFMGVAASVLLGSPSQKMKMLAVTGTNGKTTSAYITRSIMRAAGLKTGMMGTIVYDDGDAETPANRTTPEGPDIQKFLAKMVSNGAECCVMEASSHGIAQGRLCGCKFDAAAFTNLAPEHLEFHSDTEDYFQAKRKLFERFMKDSARRAANAGDKYGVRLIDEFPGLVTGYCVSSEEGDGWRASVVSADVDASLVRITFPDGEAMEIRSSFIGSHNVENILTAAALADCAGADRGAIAKGIEHCAPVPGRLERYKLSNGVTAFVDYAHNQSGMECVLSALKKLAGGKLIVVWGAGGDRSRTKRPIIGGIMAMKADYSVITTDNPRSEDPRRIAKDVEMGIMASYDDAKFKIVLDRREAIAFALGMAKSGDVVLVAGKGPEREIIYGDHTEPFSDSEAIAEWASAFGLGIERQ